MAALSPDLHLGFVHLTVLSLDRALAFYRQCLGFQVRHREGETAYLGAGGADLLVLTADPGATRHHRTTGLYHFAIRVPSRLELAQVIRRVREARVPVHGASDHQFSEAFYLPDPDDNGIEIYRDRPRAEWPDLRTIDARTATLPMDIDGVMAELTRQDGTWAGLGGATVLGHVHLRVRDIPEARAFYHEVLGFDVMMDLGTALFVAAGGYHHHIGMNVWGSRGAPPAPPGAVGLRYFTIHLPAQAEADAVIARAYAAGVAVEEHPAGRLLRDPSANGLVITTGPGR
jgi:catechol 2,3-dioxygenase